jgi:hypothetical protein
MTTSLEDVRTTLMPTSKNRRAANLKVVPADAS